MTRPLDGVRVLDLARLLPGPFCTLVLSDLGAQVDKVEDPHVGDYLRAFPPLVGDTSARFLSLNRDKRSICLDLKNPDGKAAFVALIPRYDVVVESFRPGVLDRLGLGWEALHALNPRLVLCSISGYGQTGPMRERAGHDLNYLAIAGVLSQAGPATDGQAPPVLPIQLADLGGGALWGAVGIVAALYSARATGQGRHLDIAMCEGALSFLVADHGNFAATGTQPPRGGDLLTGGVACYGVYPTQDGKFLSVGALEPKFWLAFNHAIGRTCDLSELIGDATEQARVRGEVGAILLQRTQKEWMEIFSGCDACVEPVLGLDELPSHPQHRARQLFFDIDGLPQMRTPLGTVENHRRPPGLGEHTRDLLVEAGFTPAQIDALPSRRRRQIIHWSADAKRFSVGLDENGAVAALQQMRSQRIPRARQKARLQTAADAHVTRPIARVQRRKIDPALRCRRCRHLRRRRHPPSAANALGVARRPRRRTQSVGRRDEGCAARRAADRASATARP